jgi:putative endonuclease
LGNRCWDHADIFTTDVSGRARAARHGLREEESFSSDAKKQEARRTGVRGETYAYWYLRRQGYIFAARNYTPRGIEDEIDLVGYDGKTLAFVEVRTRTIREDLPALPELSINREEQHVVVRTAQRFLAEGHVSECPRRFDVMAMDNCPGQPPVERLHKDAFSPQMCGAWREDLHVDARRGTIQSLRVAHPARVTPIMFEEDCFAGVA